MHTSEYRRRNDSAAHYRGLVASSSALRTTLTLAAESLAYPMIMLNILDEHLQHTLLTVGMDDRPSLHRTDVLCDSVIRTGRPVLITASPPMNAGNCRRCPKAESAPTSAYP